MFGLISIHDVMPGTLTDVKSIINLLEKHQVAPLTLLIVPGKEWKKNELSLLKEFQNNGYVLAGHGKIHKTKKIKSIKHWIHSIVLSRDSAEHLSLQREQVIEIMQFSYQWFQDVGLKRPFLYVPPAWALGNVDTDDLKNLPFKLYETLTGIYDSDTDLTHKLPLIGFEADNLLRIWFLQIFNSLNKTLSRFINRPLRIAIHPSDLELGLASQILPVIKQCETFISYDEIIKQSLKI